MRSLTSPSRERGFVQFLLGNPLLALSAALGIALVVAGISLKVQTARISAAKAETAQAKGELDAFVAATKRAGEEQEKANAAKEEQWKQALAAQRAAASRDRAALVSRLDELRNRPVRPDGSEIAVQTCAPSGDHGVSSKFIPIAEYESLQERAAYDALQVTQLQDYILATQ